MSEGAPSLEYQEPPHGRRASAAVWIGVVTALLADLSLLVAIFIWNGGHIWGPYLNPPVTVSWAHPILLGSIVLGVVALFASGIGLVRPAPGAWKAAAAIASLLYLVGFGCVVVVGLI